MAEHSSPQHVAPGSETRAGELLAPPLPAGRRSQETILDLLPTLILGLLLIATIFWVQHGTGKYIQRVVIGIGIDIILVVSLNLSNGFTGVFSLGHIGFMALGAYSSAILTLPLKAKGLNLPDLPAWLAGVQLAYLPALLIGGLLAAIVGFLVGYPMMRLKGHYVAVATLGFLVIVRVVLINADAFTRGSRTFSGVLPYTTLWWVYAWAVITVYAVWRIVRSPYGRAMLAVREDEIAARSIGVNVLHARLVAFCVSAFLTGVAGGLWAHFLVSFSPNSFYFVETFAIITMLVVGGMGSISGSVIAAVGLTALSELLRNAERGVSLGPIHLPPLYGLSQILLSVFFVLVMIYRREGLMGSREIDIGWIPRRLRRAIASPAQRAPERR